MRLMGQLLKTMLVCFCWFFLLQTLHCDVSTNASEIISTWTCLCSPTAPIHASASNCSAFCNCVHDGRGTTEDGWSCSCTSDRTALFFGDIHSDTCFTSCNCTSDLKEETKPHSRHISHKGIAVVLLICIIVATVIIISFTACYFYGKDNNYSNSAFWSSKKETRTYSRTSSISNLSASLPELNIKVNSLLNPIIVFAQKLHFMLGSGKGDFPGTMAIRFLYVDLEIATNKFSSDNLIGVGGSSSVYRGQLKNGKIVAVKRLKPRVANVLDSEFLTEIDLLSRLNHRHVVPLLGFCLEARGRQSERLLVFELMLNGSLRECLDARGKKPMDWETRVSIAIGAARGLEYMHEAAAPAVLHRDIKSTNILLDDKYTPKITDLGMAKRLMVEEASSSSASSPARMLGTFGYFAPEYAVVGKATLKSDVFSFGVVVLELITGRQPIKSTSKGDESLALWGMARLRKSQLVISELPDPLLEGNFPHEEMHIMAHLARECLQWDPEARPTMSQVVQMLSLISPAAVPTRSRNLRVASFFVDSSSSPHSLMDGVIDAEPNGSEFSSEMELGGSTGDTVLLAEDMARLIFLEEKSSHGRDDCEGAVDLIEPRFESFV